MQEYAAEVPGAHDMVREISVPLHRGKGWLKFLGVLMILYGALLILSIVGILVAWLPIWMGVLLFQAATSVEEAFASGDHRKMAECLGKLRVYFTINGVLALLGLLFVAAALFLGVLGAMLETLS